MHPRQTRVLVIDNEENDFIYIRYLLQKSDSQKYRVDWVKSYEEAAPHFLSDEYDVFLLDYKLIGRNGIELLKAAKEAGCEVPIILLTGNENSAVDEEAEAFGASDYLVKTSLTETQISRSIRYSLKQAATLQALRETQLRFELFMRNIPCAIWIKNDEGRYLFVNEWLEKAMQWRFEDWLGKRDDELWPQATAARFTESDQEVFKNNNSLQIEETAPLPDGRHIWLTTKFPVLLKPGVMLIGAAALDITERKALQKQILEIATIEQQRIGQDIHDGLGQHLTGIACLASALKNYLESKSANFAKASEQSGEIARLVQEAIAQSRALAHGLNPLLLEESGLAIALHDLAYQVQNAHKINCRVEANGEQYHLDHTTAIHLYRITQEAVNNAIKHASAKNILIHLSAKNGEIVLFIEDDGIGFGVHLKQNTGLGLKNMKSRCQAIEGRLKIDSRAGSRNARVLLFAQP